MFIVGEKRGLADSARLVSDIVEAYTGFGKCIDVGLEISSEAQKNIESFMSGDSDLSAIRINTFVSHKEYKNMLRNFKALKAGGKCVRVFGIDIPDTVPIEKDVWMARVISTIAGDNPMLVLVGNRHTFKKVEWKSDDRKRRF